MRLDSKKLIALLFIACIGGVHAQIRITAEADRKAYLPYEPIMLTINLENNSGNTLTFPKPGVSADADSGKRLADYVSCAISDEQSRSISKTPFAKKLFGDGPVNLAGELVLPSGGNRKLTVQLNKFYRMSHASKYSITVQFRHRRLPVDFNSGKIVVSVVPGVTKFSQYVGVPSTSQDEEAEISQRKCELVSFHGEINREYVLRISDDKFVYCTNRLSKHLSGDIPDFKVDARSQIHIIVQTEAKNFTYWLFDIDGGLKQTSLYRYDKRLGVPKLYRDPDIGRVMVVGGVKYVPEEDEEIELPEYDGEKNL